MKRILLSLATLLVLPSLVSADTYHYVHPGLTTGSNDGTGWTDAWKSFDDIDWVAMEAEASSEPVYLYVKKGITTSSRLYVKTGGSSDMNRIFITTDPSDSGAMPVINRYDHGSAITKSSTVPVSYITIDGLSLFSTVGARPVWWEDACGTAPSNYITLRNCDIRAEGFGVTFLGCSSNHGSYFVIENNNISFIGDPSVSPGDGIMLRRNDHVYIRRNVVSNFPHTGIPVYYGNYVYVYENDVSGPDISYGRAMGILADNAYIYRNYIHDQRTRDQNGGDNLYVYNNVYANMKDCCPEPLVGDCPDAEIHEQESCDSPRGGQALNFRKVPDGYATQLDKNVYALNNIFYRSARSAILVGGDEGNTFSSLTIKNNIFYDNFNTDCVGSECYYTEYTIALWDWSLGSNPFNNVAISHNIFWPITKGRTDDACRTASGGRSPQEIPTDGGLTGINDCPWSAGTGNIRVAPGMTNPANDVYKPTSSSNHIIDKGEALPPIPGALLGGDIDDAIHPDTDFNDFVNTVSSIKQGFDGSEWEIGAIVYQAVTCTEDWICTDWVCSACMDSQQDCTRTCTDQENCGTTINKPPEAETRSCGTGSLVGHWTFDTGDISGDQALDKSGFGNHGTIHDATPATGRVGDALYFDGLDDYIDSGDNVEPPDEFSFSVWVLPEGDQTNSVILAKYSAFPAEYEMMIGGTGTYVARSDKGPSYNSTIFARDPDHHTSYTGWVHVAGTYGADMRMRVFVNGELKAEGDIFTRDTSRDDPLTIGKRTYPGAEAFFNGTIDDVMIWNRSLSATEIFDLYESSFHPCDTSPKDGCIRIDELGIAIDHWKYDSTTNPMGEVMEAVTLWSRGTGCVQ